jgi:hypothetical protein
MAKARTKSEREPRTAGSGRAPAKAEQAPLLTRRQRRRLGGVGLVLAIVLALGGGWWLYAQSRPAPGEFVPSLGNLHIPTADTPHQPYNSDPPTSGPHLPHIAPWGIHTRPIVKELQVHNLEDGGVALQYRPDCADRVLAGLRAILDRYADHVVLAPYPGLDRCIAMTAWTRIDKLDEVDGERITRFIDAYRGIDHHPR